MRKELIFGFILFISIILIGSVSAQIEGQLYKVHQNENGSLEQETFDNANLIYSFSDGQTLRIPISGLGDYKVDLSNIYCWDDCNIYPTIYTNKIEAIENNEVISYINDPISSDLPKERLNFKSTNNIFTDFKDKAEEPVNINLDINNSVLSIEKSPNSKGDYIFVHWNGLIYSENQSNVSFRLDIEGGARVLLNNLIVLDNLNSTVLNDFSLELPKGISNITLDYYSTVNHQPNLLINKSRTFEKLDKKYLKFLDGGSRKVISSKLVSVASTPPGPYYPDTTDYSYTIRQDIGLITSSKTPLLLVHGLTGTDPYWDDIPSNFIDNGHDVWEFYYSPNTLRIERGGVLLEDGIRKVLNNYPNKKVDLVTHSMGGLISRTYVNDLSKNSLGQTVTYKNNVQSLVMIGTPNYGSHLANLCLNGGIVLENFCWIIGKDYPANTDLAVGSQLTWANFKAGLKGGIRYLVIAGTDNDLVNIVENAEASDSVVAASSASLLNIGVPLVLIKANHNNEHGGCATAFGDRCRWNIWDGFYYDNTMSNLITHFLNGASTNTLKSDLYSGEYYIDPNDPNANTNYPYQQGAVLIKFSGSNPDSVEVKSHFQINGAIRSFALDKNQDTKMWFYYAGDILAPGLTLPSGIYDIIADGTDTNQDIEIKALQTNIKEVSSAQGNCNPVNACCDNSGNLIPSGGQPKDYPFFDGTHCAGNDIVYIDFGCDGINVYPNIINQYTVKSCPSNSLCVRGVVGNTMVSSCVSNKTTSGNLTTSIIRTPHGMGAEYDYVILAPSQLPDGIIYNPSYNQSQRAVGLLDLDNKTIELTTFQSCSDPGDIVPVCTNTNSFQNVIYNGMNIVEGNCAISTANTTICWKNQSVVTITTRDNNSITCSKDLDCNDSDNYTIDTCENAGTINSYCGHQRLTCISDLDCNDNNNHTLDQCFSAGPYSTTCIHLPISCLNDLDCNDNNVSTSDVCQNQNTTNSICINQQVCIPNLVNTTWNSWTNLTCVGNQRNQSRFKVQYDNRSCGEVNQTIYEYQLVGPIYLNTSWGIWQNVSCLSNNKMNQTRNLNQYDLYSCASNITIQEYQSILPCDFCTPNLINTTVSNWENISCLANNKMNQSRFLTQYDSKLCGEVQNKTFYEYRAVLDCPINITNTSSMVISPLSGIYSNGGVMFNLSSSQEFTKLTYSDNGGRESTLCTNCWVYAKKKTLNDGNHTLSFKGTLLDGKTVINQTNLLIDSQDPKMSTTKPQNNKYTNGSDFYIKYSEDNCKVLTLTVYGLAGSSSINSSCLSGENIEKSMIINLSSFDKQGINYKFSIEDIAGNTKETRLTKVKVDTTLPIISNINSLWSKDIKNKNYINFNISIVELNMDSVQYIDSFDGSRAKWNTLCTRLNKNNECIVKKYFKTGTHNITIQVSDKAGNSIQEKVGFLL